MILRSVCIWISVSVIWFFLMIPIISRDNAHEQRLAEIEKEITEVRAEYEREENQKSELLKQRDELSQRIARETELGEEAIRLLKGN